MTNAQKLISNKMIDKTGFWILKILGKENCPTRNTEQDAYLKVNSDNFSYLPMLSLPESVNIVSLRAVFIKSLQQDQNKFHQKNTLGSKRHVHIS